MAKISLYGRLGKKFGKSFKLDVRSPAEAVRALTVQLTGFRADIESGDYHVLVDELSLGEGDLSSPVSLKQHIKIIPVVAGAKSGLFSVIAGIALIAAAVFVPGLQGLAAYAVGGLGGALVMGGMSSILTPTPNKAELKEVTRTENSYFRAPENVEAQGQVVPLVYGIREVGSMVISSGISVE